MQKGRHLRTSKFINTLTVEQCSLHFLYSHQPRANFMQKDTFARAYVDLLPNFHYTFHIWYFVSNCYGTRLNVLVIEILALSAPRNKANKIFVFFLAPARFSPRAPPSSSSLFCSFLFLRVLFFFFSVVSMLTPNCILPQTSLIIPTV